MGAAPPQAAPSPFVAEVDTDKDGVPDWQEGLIGTDPHNPDTDGDGTPDVVTPAIAQAFIHSTSSTPASDAIGERLISQYLFLKNSESYTAERGTGLGESLAQNLRVPVAYTPIEWASLSVIPDAKGAAGRYQIALKKAIEPLASLDEPEFVIYARYVDSRDARYLSLLRERAVVYRGVANAIAATKVPESIAEDHLALANALAYFGTVLESMATYAQDPIASLSLLRTYNDAERYVGETFDAVAQHYAATNR